MSEKITIKQTSTQEFNKLASNLHPVIVPLEQSEHWGKLDDTIDGRTFIGNFRFDDSKGRLIALGSATLYTQRGRNWIWFKHGPLFACVPTPEVVSALCKALQQTFKTWQGVQPLFIRLSSPTRARPLLLPFEHTMYDQTVVVELDKTEAELLAGMSQSGRQGIRKAKKLNVQVREITEDTADYFSNFCYPILQETAQRDGFGIHPLSVYKNFLTSLTEIARLYVAEVDGKVEAWAITTEYNQKAMYYYGGSSAHARQTSAAYLLHWHIMQQMKLRGNITYDFMGIAGKHFTSLKNVTQFKIKFSKNIVTIPTTYDLPLQFAKYRLLATAIKTKRKLNRS